jgi:hypothetical protein
MPAHPSLEKSEGWGNLSCAAVKIAKAQGATTHAVSGFGNPDAIRAGARRNGRRGLCYI